MCSTVQQCMTTQPIIHITYLLIICKQSKMNKQHTHTHIYSISEKHLVNKPTFCATNNHSVPFYTPTINRGKL